MMLDMSRPLCASLCTRHGCTACCTGDSTDAAPAFDATALRHPAAAELHTTSFVPNDVRLGGDGAAPFIVLTGVGKQVEQAANSLLAGEDSDLSH